jgi:hypothetical protein
MQPDPALIEKQKNEEMAKKMQLDNLRVTFLLSCSLIQNYTYSNEEKKS